jgi:hypothetical protein
MGGIGFDVALYLLERDNRSPLDPETFASHWGIAADGSLKNVAPREPKMRITMLKRSTTPFGHTLGRTTGWVHRAEALHLVSVPLLNEVEPRALVDLGASALRRDKGPQGWSAVERVRLTHAESDLERVRELRARERAGAPVQRHARQGRPLPRAAPLRGGSRA